MRLLDTNIVSYWIRGDSNIISRLMYWAPCELAISAITLAEILYGIEKSLIKKEQRRYKIDSICSQLNILTFDDNAAQQYAIVRADLEKYGVPISERDLQIAAIALAHELFVVTHNTKEFSRVKGLSVEDWS